jgi:uncharacterized protein YebE (UPF0316 family)
MSLSLRPLGVLVLVLTEVGLWQWRVLLTGRGHRGLPTLLGIVGAVLQVTAVAQVVTNLGDLLTVMAYAAGVGGGVLLGVWVATRFSAEPVRVNIVTTDHTLEQSLRHRSWPVILYTGRADGNSVHVLEVLAPARRRSALLRDIDELAPHAARTVETLDGADVRAAMAVERPLVGDLS